jgi:hypothetical protein
LDNTASSVVATPATALKGAGGADVAMLLPLPKKECNVKACVGGDRTRRRRPRRGRSKLLVVVFMVACALLFCEWRERGGAFEKARRGALRRS